MFFKFQERCSQSLASSFETAALQGQHSAKMGLTKSPPRAQQTKKQRLRMIEIRYLFRIFCCALASYGMASCCHRGSHPKGFCPSTANSNKNACSLRDLASHVNSRFEPEIWTSAARQIEIVLTLHCKVGLLCGGKATCRGAWFEI